jgi:hypothetical protein
VILPQTLVRRWKKEGIALLPPESPVAVVDAFARIGSVATRDVLEFYSEFGGMEPMHDGGLKIWSLCDIAPENSERSELGPVGPGLIGAVLKFDGDTYLKTPAGARGRTANRSTQPHACLPSENSQIYQVCAR